MNRATFLYNRKFQQNFLLYKKDFLRMLIKHTQKVLFNVSRSLISGLFYTDVLTNIRTYSLHKAICNYSLFEVINCHLILLLQLLRSIKHISAKCKQLNAIFPTMTISLPILCHRHQSLNSYAYSNNASNSSVPIFSFSIRSSAHLSSTFLCLRIRSLAFA